MKYRRYSQKIWFRKTWQSKTPMSKLSILLLLVTVDLGTATQLA